MIRLFCMTVDISPYSSVRYNVRIVDILPHSTSCMTQLAELPIAKTDIPSGRQPLLEGMANLLQMPYHFRINV
ncbi:hypothetical protein B9D94_29055 [Paenibacillus sp. Cedars]|nr:hypothetical protein B9D94_29055 [Paenibacillus sp. Cedars]